MNEDIKSAFTVQWYDNTKGPSDAGFYHAGRLDIVHSPVFSFYNRGNRLPNTAYCPPLFIYFLSSQSSSSPSTYSLVFPTIFSIR